MYILYGSAISGNCWKPAFMLRQRGLPFRWVEVDILAGASRTPDFLAMNPNGRVPLLRLPDGRALAESDAMLLHLGEDTAWLPRDAYDRAKVYEWLFFEQYTHEPSIATVRFWVAYLNKCVEWSGKIAATMVKGHAALGVMERQLAQSAFLVGATPTLADIALYAYTHVAHEGGYDLEGYPAVRAWLARFAALPGFVAMPCTAPGKPD